MRKAIAAGSGLIMLASCAATTEPRANGQAEPLRPPPGQCDAGAVQSYVGQTATQAAGSAILQASGARSLRWGPPDTAWTMDYRDDRVNVRFDRDMIITAVSCG